MSILTIKAEFFNVATLIRKKQDRLFKVLALLLFSYSCTPDQGNKINTEEAKSATEQIFEGVSEAEAHLTKSGGSLSIAEAKLLIPSGAISSPSKASLKKVKTGFSEASQDERLAIAWNLEKGSLLKDVVVSLKVDAIANAPWLKVAVYDPSSKELKAVLTGDALKVEETPTGKKWITFASAETDAVFIVIDPEVINTKISINDDALYTKEPLVSAKILASSGSYTQRAIIEGDDCSDAPLNAEKTSPVEFVLSHADGPKILCGTFTNFWGDSAAGTALITLDTVPPSAVASMPGFINAEFTLGAQTAIVGNSTDETSGVASVGVSLSSDGGTLCLNEEKKAFDSPCPVWHTPEGLEDWRLAVDDDMLVDGTTYSIYASAGDRAGNIQAEPSLATFVWDLTPPVAALDNVPQGFSKTVSLDIDVLADTGLTEYRYKVGPSAAINCSSASGYSLDFFPEAQNIRDSLINIPDGAIKLCVIGKDAAGNIQSFATATAALWVKDTLAPSVDVGESIIARVSTTIDATVSDLNGVASYQWTKKNGTGTLTFSTPNAEDTDVSAVGEGIYEILLTVTDAAGNSASDSLYFTWDTVAPNSGFTINAAALHTKTTAVSLSLVQSTDVVAFRKANGSDCSGATWEEFISYPLAHTLDPGDGLKTVCLEVKDAVGNVSITSLDSITLDTTLPLSVLTVASQLGPESTAGTQTKLSGTVTETGSGIDKIFASVKNDTSGMCLNTLKTSFSEACPYWLVAELASGWSVSLADSILVNTTAYTVESKALDLAGNEQTPVVSSGFTWDAQAPNAAFKINANPTEAIYANNAAVNIDMTVPSDIAMYRINSGSDCSGLTWQTFVSSPISFSLVGGNGVNTVCLQVKDVVDNVSGVSTDTIILDTSIPTSLISTVGTLGISSTVGTTTKFEGTANDAQNLLDKVYLSVQQGVALCLNDDLVTFDATCPHWLEAQGTSTWFLDIADTTFADGVNYTLASKATDLAGNEQVSFGSSSVTWDGVPPSPTFVINANDNYTNNAAVVLTLSLPTGVARYRMANGATCSGAAWVNYSANNIPLTLTGGEGLRTVCLEVEDSVGNASAAATDTITLDLTPPTSVSTIASDLGPESTPGNTTVLSGTASDALSGLANIVLSIQDGNGFYLRADTLAYDSVSPVWHTASGTGNWTFTLADGLLTDTMMYQISIKGSDNVGNTESPAVTTSFTWDSNPPSSAFSIVGGAFTKNTNVTVSLTDSAGVAMYRIAENTDCSGASWVSYGAISFNLSNGDGSKTLCLQVKDSLENISGTTTHSIILDATAPSSTVSTTGTYGPVTTGGPQTAFMGSATDAGGSLVSSVALSIEETGSGLCLNALKTGFTAACPEWHSATGTTSWTLWLDDTLFADGLTYAISSQAQDGAANVQVGTGTNSITWDTAAPSSLFVIDGDAPYAVTTSVNLTLTDPTGVAQYRKANSANCSGAAWIGYTTNPIAHTLTASQGAQTVCLEVKDAVGNVSVTTTDSIIYDSLPPTASLTSAPSNPTNVTTLNTSVGGTGVISYKYKIITGDASGCSSGSPAWSSEITIATPITNNISAEADGLLTLCVIGVDQAGNWQSSASASYKEFVLDRISPSVTSLSISNSDPTNTNVLVMGVVAGDERSNISHFCLKYNSSSPPDIDSPCWIAVNAPSPGLTPSPTLNLTGFNYLSGYIPGVYTVYSWVRDAAGNISTLSSAGAGTVNIDMKSLTYTPGTPPTVFDVIASATDAPANPMTGSDTTTPATSDVYIKWHAEDAEGFPATPIDIYYTEDDEVYTPVALGLINGQNGSCTIDNPSTSIDDSATGCYLWNSGAPVSTYFRIQVRVTDSASMTTSKTSNPLNTNSLNILSGNTDSGINSSAISAIYFSELSSNTLGDPHSFVITSNGTLFYRDPMVGVLYMSPSDGVLKVLLPNTGTITGNDSPVSAATAKKALAIALDEQERLLVFDYDTIRRIDTAANPMTISHLIGGGALTSDGVSPADVAITPPGVLSNSNNKLMMFSVAGNGKVYFQSDNYDNVKPSNGYRIRIYDPQTGLVTSISPSGTGHNNGDTTTDISDCAIREGGIGFDSTTSNVNVMQFLVYHHSTYTNCTAPSYSFGLANVDPLTGVSTAPHPPHNVSPTLTAHYGHFVTARNGQLYYFSKYIGWIRLYNQTTNTWTNIAGTGTVGDCQDGTPALSCPIDVSDVFVSGSGTVYFVSRGKIRMVDPSGNIATLLGQGYSFGDGGQAISARFKQIQDFDLTNDNRVILIDRIGFTLREFTIGGTIDSIAGNGNSGSPNTTAAANTQPIYFITSGSFFDRLVVNPSNGDVYMGRSTQSVSVLDRISGKWVHIAGSGATAYYSGDGLAGSNIRFYTYVPQPVGFDGQKVLVAVHQYTAPNHHSSNLKLYDKDTKIQSHLVGSTNNYGGAAICSAGTSVTNCTMPIVHNAPPKMTYDSYDNRWLFSAVNSNYIRTASPAGGTVETLVTLPRNFSAFAYKRDAGATVNIVYYCAISDGHLYKYDLNTLTETAIDLPIANMQCSGRALKYSYSRNSLMFIFTYNNLAGIAEYLNP